VTEAELQRAVIQLARLLGWWAVHFRPALTDKGWRTPVQGDGEGFPDLILARPGRLLVVELKKAPKKPTPAQLAWLELLVSSGVEATWWSDRDWLSGKIEAVLRGELVLAEAV
jgi:hypothetical protein